MKNENNTTMRKLSNCLDTITKRSEKMAILEEHEKIKPKKKKKKRSFGMSM